MQEKFKYKKNYIIYKKNPIENAYNKPGRFNTLKSLKFKAI